MTGIAAESIGGVTLHSFLGVGVDKTLADRQDCLAAIFKDARLLKRWIETHILLIDEGMH
jgi:hypothetical protein